MTDADVDGAHIRTLLLTFFFRQMPELIEQGHLYVAQPPLYRISDGKNEIFIRDEEEFNSFLLNRISNAGQIELANGELLRGKALSRLLKELFKFYEALERLVRKGYSRRFIEFLASFGIEERKVFKDKKFVEGLVDSMEKEGFEVIELFRREEDGYHEFKVIDRARPSIGASQGGQSFWVRWEFLSSPELRNILKFSKQFKRLKLALKAVSVNGDRKELEDIKEAMEFLLEKGKKGLTIQRYKGLGEMNPEQLWSTTMDPERRSLVKVRIEDAVEADEIFAILMGDRVEPRREFIQQNALEVTELDI